MKLRLLSCLVLFTVFNSFSQIHTINVVGMSFDPDTVTINLGDTIEFGPLGYHNAVEVDESTWIANGTTSNGGFDFPLGSPGGYFIADSAKTYYYVCQPHATMGMKGVIIVNSTDCNAIVGGTSIIDSCGVCQQAYIYNYVTHVVTLLNDTSNLVLGPTDMLVMPDNPSNPYWNSSCSGCMDPVALNYDPFAIFDDSSCQYLSPPVNLFFSEHAEGSSNNKYFEVFNPTSDTIDLTYYAFAIVNNSPVTSGVYEYWVNFDSGSVILPNDVYVVVHPSADPFIIAEADMDYGSLSNGDDGIGLVYGIEPVSPTDPVSGGYEVLDWIGDWNGDPGQGWDVAGTNDATRNHTLVRKCAISQGDSSWMSAAGTDPVNSQWIVLAQNDWTNLGVHSICPCDSTTNSYTSIIDTLCNGLSITVGNNTYDSTGIYYDTLAAFNGCDSIVTTFLTVLSTSASSVINDITICDGDSVFVGSSIYTITGSYVDVLINSSGCDSTITTNVTVQTPVNQNITICDGDSLIVGNSVYHVSGNYVDTIISSIGCDSIVITNLTIYSQFNPISGGIPNNSIGGGSFYSGSQYLEMSCYLPSELVSAVVYAEDTVSETFEIRDNNGNVLSDTLVTVIPGGHRIYFNYNMIAGTNYELGVSGNSNNLYRNNSGVNYPYNFGTLASVTSSKSQISNWMIIR